jgi:hypothetical protein
MKRIRQFEYLIGAAEDQIAILIPDICDDRVSLN